MAIITISRGSYSHGKEIAEKVAEELGYECISREVLLEASEHFNIKEVKLIRALHDAPSILDRFTSGKQRYIAYILEQFLRHVQTDNVVYHGLAGHFFLRGISHALKVRIITDLEERIAAEMKRENISREKARHILKKDDYERRRWSLEIHGIDAADPILYDLVIHIRQISVSDAVDLVCHTARLPHFQTTDASQKAMDDLFQAACVRGAIVNDWPSVEVFAKDGKVVTYVDAPVIHEAEIKQSIRTLTRKVCGVEELEVHVRPISLLGSD